MRPDTLRIPEFPITVIHFGEVRVQIYDPRKKETCSFAMKISKQELHILSKANYLRRDLELKSKDNSYSQLLFHDYQMAMEERDKVIQIFSNKTAMALAETLGQVPFIKE